MVGIAEHPSALPEDIRSQNRVAAPRREAFHFVEDTDCLSRVRKAVETSETVEQPSARPRFVVDIREEVGRVTEPLGRRQPGVRALGPVARLD